MARRRNNSGFRSRDVAQYISTQEAAAVAAKMESLRRDAEPVQPTIAEKQLAAGLARNIGELSTGLAFRYDAFLKLWPPFCRHNSSAAKRLCRAEV